MKRILLGLLLISSTALAATGATLPDSQKISADDLRQMQVKGEVFQLLDARVAATYDAVHIEGALLGDATKIETLSKTTPTVTYCNANCYVSISLMNKLKEQGFTNVRAMTEGIQEWEKKGYPVVKNPVAANSASTPISADQPCGDSVPCHD